MSHTPLPWKVQQTVIHGREYGGHWIEPADEDQLICMSGSGGARSYTQRVIDTQDHDDNDANAVFIVEACNSYYEMREALAAKDAEIAKLREALTEWHPISTCPIRESVDLWCVYGGEEFAQFEGGAPIGRLVSNRFKTVEYGFFGNQSNDGVPRRDAPDLKPVAWRKAVPLCPAEIIAEALGLPLTRADALAAEEVSNG